MPTVPLALAEQIVLVDEEASGGPEHAHLLVPRRPTERPTLFNLEEYGR